MRGRTLPGKRILNASEFHSKKEVKSEIHSEIQPTLEQFSCLDMHLSHYQIKTITNRVQINSAETHDEDGDFDVPRRDKIQRISTNDTTDLPKKIAILHRDSTSIEHTGLQVWRASFLLADFIIHHMQMFRDKKILEIGSGLGFVSIVVSFVASKVFLTDSDEEALQLAYSNVDMNSRKCLKESNIVIRKFDWMEDDALCPLSTGKADKSSDKLKSTMSWKPSDIAHWSDVSFILASDILYDDDSVDSLMRKMRGLLSGSRLLFIAIEKRMAFCANNMSVVCVGYDTFKEMICQHNDISSVSYFDLVPPHLMRCDICRENQFFVASRIELDFPQYLDYNRNRELELWKVAGVCK